MGPIALVVIHGWISHLEVYWEQPRYAQLMNRLSRQMRVLVFDKPGTGMSDRFARPPDLGARMDDVRAVMDAAHLERAALFGWGTGGPPSALFSAATHPERTIAVCTDTSLLERRVAGYPWGWDDEEKGGIRACFRGCRRARAKGHPGPLAALPRTPCQSATYELTPLDADRPARSIS